MHLYLDTTHGIQLGLLNNQYDWIEINNLGELKSSAVIHAYINDLLVKYNQEILDISSLVYCAGPGSYTGMRVSEGIAQIFEMAQIKLYSFYHFEIPQIYGNQHGKWLDHAFKGEIFIYDWNENKSSKSRIPLSDLILNNDCPVFSFDDNFLDKKVSSTYSLIMENPSTLLKNILTEPTSRRELYYYRELSEEFRRG